MDNKNGIRLPVHNYMEEKDGKTVEEQIRGRNAKAKAIRDYKASKQDIIKAMTEEKTITVNGKAMKVRKMIEKYTVSDLPNHKAFPVAEKQEDSEGVLKNITVNPSANQQAIGEMRVDKKEITRLETEIDAKTATLLALKKKSGSSEVGQNIVIQTPAIILSHQKAIQAKRPEEKNKAGENLWNLCDNMMKDSSKIQYVDDGNGEKGVYFPSLGVMQRIAYLGGGSMKKGKYSGQHHYKDYSVEDAFGGMPAQETTQLIYKKTLDTLPQEFTDILNKDMYDKGYRWKTLTDANKIFGYIAKELGLQFEEDSTSDQTVVKASMYLTGAVTWEWLNTDWNSKKDGDALGKLDGKPISGRAVVQCNDGGQSNSRSDFGHHDCAVPLLKEIV